MEKQKFTDGEIAVLTAIAMEKNYARKEEISKYTHISAQRIRHIVRGLKESGLVVSMRPSDFTMHKFFRDDENIPVKELKPKEVLYHLTKDYKDIVKEHDEIKDWGEKLRLDEKTLIERVKNFASNST